MKFTYMCKNIYIWVFIIVMFIIGKIGDNGIVYSSVLDK